MNLTQLAKYHEKQAQHFLPFGKKNVLTRFHTEAAKCCRHFNAHEVLTQEMKFELLQALALVMEGSELVAALDKIELPMAAWKDIEEMKRVFKKYAIK